ncbi:MAG: FecR domain-containing protein [Cyclobacteriaceae bacterium]
MDPNSGLKDFFEGRMSKDQARSFLDWLQSSEGDAFLSNKTEEIWKDNPENLNKQNPDVEKIWKRIKTNPKLYPKPEKQKAHREFHPSFVSWFNWACSFLLIGFLLWFYLMDMGNVEKPNIENSDSEKIVTKYNPPGQKTKVHLQDGSVVYLNSDSKITYPENFLSNRSIELEGEGFFTVSKDSLNPFKVLANGITTTALGTSFNVNTFNPGEKVKVTLVSGMVNINKEGLEDLLLLKPGEQSVLTDTGEKFQKRAVNVSKFISWIDGILIFEKTPILDVISALERWYGVNIQLQGNVPQSLCSGTFQNNEMLENVLEVLSSSVGFKHQLKGKKVIINFNK